jgi:hypothetical protein
MRTNKQLFIDSHQPKSSPKIMTWNVSRTAARIAQGRHRRPVAMQGDLQRPAPRREEVDGACVALRCVVVL